MDVLGIEVDTIAWELRVCQKKLQSLRTDLELWAQKSVALKQDITSIHGQLSFVAQVAKPGRIFLCHMVEEMQTVQQMDDHVSLSAKFLAKNGVGAMTCCQNGIESHSFQISSGQQMQILTSGQIPRGRVWNLLELGILVG